MAASRRCSPSLHTPCWKPASTWAANAVSVSRAGPGWLAVICPLALVRLPDRDVQAILRVPWALRQSLSPLATFAGGMASNFGCSSARARPTAAPTDGSPSEEAMCLSTGTRTKKLAARAAVASAIGKESTPAQMRFSTPCRSDSLRPFICCCATMRPSVTSTEGRALRFVVHASSSAARLCDPSPATNSCAARLVWIPIRLSPRTDVGSWNRTTVRVRSIMYSPHVSSPAAVVSG